MYIHYIVASLHNHCCHGNTTICCLFIVDIHIAVKNIKVFSVAMEMYTLVKLQSIVYCC